MAAGVTHRIYEAGSYGPRFAPELDDSWRVKAACVGMDHLFFPGWGESSNPARKICATCPVILECLDYAVRTRTREGVWGGMVYRERVIWARKQRRNNDRP